jgi:hypothetical protein
MSSSFMRSVFTSFGVPGAEADFSPVVVGSGVLRDDFGIDGNRKGAIGTGTGWGDGEGSSRGSK